MNWVDIAIIGIILFNLAFGWYKGLIRSVVNIVSIVLAFLGAKLYHGTMATILDERYDLAYKIKTAVQDMFTNIDFNYDASVSTEQVTEQLSESPYLKTFLDKFFSSEKFDQMLEKTTEGFANSFSDWASDHLMNIIGMVAVFIIIYLGVRIIGYILAKLFDVPVLKGVNQLSGLLFGGAKGIFFAMLFVLALVMISPFLDNTSLISSLETSFLGMLMYKYNVILLIFQYLV